MTENTRALSKEHQPLIPSRADLKWRYTWRIGPRPSTTRFQGYKLMATVEDVADMEAIGFGLSKNAFTIAFTYFNCERLEMRIIKKKNTLSENDEEIEIDIDSVDIETLWELDRYVTNYKKNLSKNPVVSVPHAPNEKRADEQGPAPTPLNQGENRGDIASRIEINENDKVGGVFIDVDTNVLFLDFGYKQIQIVTVTLKKDQLRVLILNSLGVVTKASIKNLLPSVVGDPNNLDAMAS
ncbi:transcription factor GTE4-like protein [Tanacetum coccineum]|uniref:Transcription factor GTE4-like protein n=1 Tax=Tanacetum coccineum TaxID=301880 RepID=A0ABQ5EHA0_9ASTR